MVLAVDLIQMAGRSLAVVALTRMAHTLSKGAGAGDSGGRPLGGWPYSVLLLSVLGLVALSLASCSRELSLEEQAKVENLNGVLGWLDAEIVEADVKQADYAGGLIKDLMLARLEVLRINRALVQQRIQAIESGAKIEVVVQAIEADPARAAQIEARIDAQRIRLATAQAEANLYSGGLIKSLKMTTAATEELALAQLYQSKLQAELGLFYPAATVSNVEPSALSGAVGKAATVETPTKDERPGPSVTIVEINTRVTESNSTWSKFAWVLTVRNDSATPTTLTATIEFLDKDGFVVDDDIQRGLVLPAFGEKTFRGYDLVDATVAGSIDKVSAKVGLR